MKRAPGGHTLGMLIRPESTNADPAWDAGLVLGCGLGAAVLLVFYAPAPIPLGVLAVAGVLALGRVLWPLRDRSRDPMARPAVPAPVQRSSPPPRVAPSRARPVTAVVTARTGAEDPPEHRRASWDRLDAASRLRDDYQFDAAEAVYRELVAQATGTLRVAAMLGLGVVLARQRDAMAEAERVLSEVVSLDDGFSEPARIWLRVIGPSIR